MNISSWLAWASADATARGLPDLKPLLETLARSTQALRDADAEFCHPALERDLEDASRRPVEERRSGADNTATGSGR